MTSKVNCGYFSGVCGIAGNNCINEPFKKKIKTMLQLLEIIPEVNYHPSSDRWEYGSFKSGDGENPEEMLDRLNAEINSKNQVQAKQKE